MMLRRLILKQENVGILTKLNQLKYLSTRYNNEKPEQQSIPSRPLDWKSFQLTNVVESKEEFKYVEKLLPIQVVPEPPKHDSYPTPSGWIPVNPEKSSKLPYHIFRTRFYNFPIYAIEREGGSRKLTKIRYVEGNIWKFDSDLRAYIEKCIEEKENKKLKIYSQVNEVQRQVLIKGHFMDYINMFMLECGF